jgi:RNA polymerase sigma-70 factor (ECF subfamily)
MNGMMGVMAGSLPARAAAGIEPLEFESWMKAEQKRVYLLCRRLLGDRDEADTATQEVFLKAYRALSNSTVELDEPARWLTRVAVNTCLDRLRSRRWRFWKQRPEPEDEEIIIAFTPAAGPDAEDELFARQIAVRLNRALEGLSPRQRSVFTLRHFEDCSLEEIGAILGLDLGTVKVHLSRSLAKLRKELKDLYLMAGPASARRRPAVAP